MRCLTGPAIVVATLLCVPPAVAQDDLRDVVRLKNGKELRGRVAEPFAPGDLILVQGGKRVRVPPADIDSTTRVGDLVRQFLQRRARLADSPRARWILVEWASSNALPGLARAEAMLLALEGDERAHEWLGHKRRGDQWLWQHDDKWLLPHQLDQAIVQSPVTLPGERFVVTTDGDLRAGLHALLDLERLGVFWLDTFGNDLQLREVLVPVRVFVHRDATDFPKWGFRAVPFFAPDPHGDLGHTYHTGAVPTRPKLLFFTGTQGLLYHALIGSVSPRDDRDRACAWLEVGLGMMAEQAFAGAPGRAAPGEPQGLDLQALQALQGEQRLDQLLHLPMYGGFYLMDDTPTAIHWSEAAMFVQFLLRADNVPATRSAFLSYVRAALGDRRGDSSTAFDQAMGRRIEEFAAPFRHWLTELTRH